MKKPRISRLIAALAISISMFGTSTSSHAWKGLDGPPFPIWREIPVKYYVNKGSFPPNIAMVAEQRLMAGFAAWSAPDCTYFDTQFGGDMPGGEGNVNDEKNVLLWINKPNSWPQELGPEDSVIGVTLPIWSNDGMGNLFIDDADIIFNNVGFCWYDYDPANPGTTCFGGKPVDTLSIITHEQGHFVGLGHTTVSGATMEPAYLGGNDLASIEKDDMDGICALYPLGGATGSAAAGGASCDFCRQSAVKSECHTVAKSCTSSCLRLGDCILECPKNDPDVYDACATECTAQFKGGHMAYTAYINCVCDVCAVPCIGQCAGPSETGACAAWNESEQGGVCDAPQFTGIGGCGCAVSGSDDDIGAFAMLGIFFAALSRRRRW